MLGKLLEGIIWNCILGIKELNGYFNFKEGFRLKDKNYFFKDIFIRKALMFFFLYFLFMWYLIIVVFSRKGIVIYFKKFGCVVVALFVDFRNGDIFIYLRLYDVMFKNFWEK